MQKCRGHRVIRWICGIIMFCILIGCMAALNGKTTRTLAATCPKKNHEDWNYEYVCGCSACGGNSSVAYGDWYWQDDFDGTRYHGSRAGDGVIVEKYDTWTTENGKGETYTNVEVTYRCYNCGYRSWDGTIYNSETYEDWNNVISFTGMDSNGIIYDEENSGCITGPQSKGAGPGAVPWYYCEFCDGKSTGSYSHNTCYAITAQVSNSAGGTVSFTDTTANRVQIGSNSGASISAIAGPGAALSISVSVDDGYEFGGWSSGETTKEITITASSDKTYTAKVSLKPSPTTTPTPTPTPIPTPIPIPGMVTWTYREEFYTNGNLDGYEISSSNEYYIGATIDNTVNITSRSYNGNTYRNGVLTVLGDCGISVENGNHLTGILTGNGVVLRKFYRTVDNPDPTTAPDPTIPPLEHTHSYGDWVYDDTNHWKECECGDIAEKDTHNFISGTPDGDGITTYTCTDCGYTVVKHTHEWVQWSAYDFWDDTYDPEIYHWKTCSYNSCNETAGKAKHTKGEYINEGNGYLVARCTVCHWIMDTIPVTVSLTFDPNGGTFPDGSTEPITFDNITYGEPTDLWQLSADFLPVKDGVEFRGWYIVGNGEGCVYTPDFTNKVCTGTSGYFHYEGNGVYTSALTQSCTLYAQWKQITYTIEYDGNGADEGIMYPSYHTVNEEKALNPNGYYYKSRITYDDGGVQSSIGATLENTLVYAGFQGWSRIQNGAVLFEDAQIVRNITTKAETVTLYAVWNYGSVILPNATATEGGCKLSGWMTEDGTFLSVLGEEGNYKEVTYPVHGSETLTAVWIPNTYTVSFDSDGGTECEPITVTYKKTYDYGNDGLPTPRRTGYVFTGWKIALTNEPVGNNTIVTTAADHTLTAVWIPNNVRIEFDYNFDYDTPAINPQKNSSFWSIDENTDWTVRLFDSAYGALPEPTREGYAFACWYLEEDEDGNGCGDYGCLISDTILITNPEKHTLHARWIKDEYRIDLDYNYDYSVWGQE